MRTKHLSETRRLHSPHLWAQCPIGEIQRGELDGVYFFDDFENAPVMITDQSIAKYDTFIVGATAFTQEKNTVGGALFMGTNDADNEEGNICTHGPAFQVSDTAADAKKLWFECRVKKSSIANNALAMFIGLGYDDGSDVSLALNDGLTDDDGALGAFSYLGFHIDQANGDSMDFVYKAEGGAQTVAIDAVHVPVADTYVKLGFFYNPDENTANRIRVFVNNVEHATKITGTNIAAATFPDGEQLGLAWLNKNGATTTLSTSTLDWWACAQLFE